MRLQIKNIEIVDPLQKRDSIGDIFVENDRIVSKFLNNADKVVDGNEKLPFRDLLMFILILENRARKEKRLFIQGRVRLQKAE